MGETETEIARVLRRGFVSSLQFFVLEQRESKAKHCRNVPGRVLGQKKIHTKSVL